MRTVKKVTTMSALMSLAHALGVAKKSGVAKDIEKAQKEHDTYKEKCLSSDEFRVNLPRIQ